MAASGSGVATAFGVQISISLAVFLIFSWLRLISFTRRFYAPKRFDSTLEVKPARIPPGFGAWIWTVYNYNEAELIKVAGLDSAMFLRVLQCGREIFIWVSLVVLIILLPINLTGDQIDILTSSGSSSTVLYPPPAPPPPAECGVPPAQEDVKPIEYSFTTFDKVSVSNLPTGSPMLWAHLVITWVVTFIVIKILNRYNTEATLLRLVFLANAPRGGPSHTVLITDIPGMRYGTLAWYARTLAGSTLFIMLPKKLQTRIFDWFESSFATVTSAVDVGGLVRATATPRSSDPGAAGPDVKKSGSDAMAKVADSNTRIALLREMEKNKKLTGITQRKSAKEVELEANDKGLDPWVQAAILLGDSNDPNPDNVKDFIHEEIESTYGRGTVAAVNPVWNQGELNPLLAEYKKIRTALEDYLDKCAFELKRRKKITRAKVSVVPASMGAWGIEKYGVKVVKVDALEFWMARLARLAELIPKAQEHCLDHPIPASFVTLNKRATQAAMTTALHHHDETTWLVQSAPEPKEIIWSSLHMRRWERTARTGLMWAAYLALLVFYIIPITAIQGLLNSPQLLNSSFLQLPGIKQIVQAILPSLVLVIFLAILPLILSIMCRLSGFVSISQVDAGVTSRYFYFQVVSVFLGSMIAGSLFNQLKQLVNDPASIISILGVAIPATATFFINYILVAGIGKVGIKFLRIPQLVIFWLLSRFASTPRARARLWADQYILYGPEIPNYTIAFLLGVVYCCINPIIAPVVLLYFSFAVISQKYNELYVFKREYESGGRLWLYMFKQMVVSLYFFQAFMIIVLGIKRFKFTFLLAPLPFITVLYHFGSLALFERPWSNMSAHDAAYLDRMDEAENKEKGAVTKEEVAEIRDMYLSPAFKVTPAEIDELLAEAEVISRRINGESLEDIEASMEDRGYVSATESEGEEEEDKDKDDSSSSSGSSSSGGSSSGVEAGEKLQLGAKKQQGASSSRVDSSSLDESLVGAAHPSPTGKAPPKLPASTKAK